MQQPTLPRVTKLSHASQEPRATASPWLRKASPPRTSGDQSSSLLPTGRKAEEPGGQNPHKDRRPGASGAAPGAVTGTEMGLAASFSHEEQVLKEKPQDSSTDSWSKNLGGKGIERELLV